MYVVMIVLVLVVGPTVSILTDRAVPGGSTDIWFLIGKWFVFWAVGIRLFTAGLSQVTRPSFTVTNILGSPDEGAEYVAQELGFANIAMGVTGLVGSSFFPEWIPAAALSGALFLGFAGVRHIGKSGKNAKEWIAAISDLFVFVVLAAYLVSLIVR